MAKSTPATDWRRTSGNGELGAANGFLTTDSGNQITTLSVLNLALLSGSYTPIPATEWDNTETVPATIWDNIEETPATIWSETLTEVIDRITQNSNTRITQDGDIRIVQQREPING